MTRPTRVLARVTATAAKLHLDVLQGHLRAELETPAEPATKAS